MEDVTSFMWFENKFGDDEGPQQRLQKSGALKAMLNNSSNNKTIYFISQKTYIKKSYIINKCSLNSIYRLKGTCRWTYPILAAIASVSFSSKL